MVKLKRPFVYLSMSSWVDWLLWHICSTDDDGYVPIDVTTILSSFPRIWSIELDFSRDLYFHEHKRVPYVEQDLITILGTWDHPFLMGFVLFSLSMSCFWYCCLSLGRFPFFFVRLIFVSSFSTNTFDCLFGIFRLSFTWLVLYHFCRYFKRNYDQTKRFETGNCRFSFFLYKA